MDRHCSACGTSFKITSEDLEFYRRISPCFLPGTRKVSGSDFQTPSDSPLSGGEKKQGEEQEKKQRNWKWKDEEEKVSDFKKIIPAEKLPDDISKIPDDILNWAIKCEESGKLFKIQKPELQFYRKMNLPIPHYHPDIRHLHRMKLRNPRKLFSRTCDHCHKPIETTFSPERPERVFCEECYLGVVI